MSKEISAEELVGLGLDGSIAGGMADQVNSLLRSAPAAECWQAVSQRVLRPHHAFPVHQFLYETIFSGWDDQRGPRPAWSPTDESLRATNIWKLMEERGIGTYEDLRRWCVENREQFWELMIEQLGVRFRRPPSRIMDPASDMVCPRWLVNAKLNIADSCFEAPSNTTAIIYRTKSGTTSTWSYGELLRWANRVANGLVESGFEPGDTIGVCLPMTAESVAIYLGIIKAGCAEGIDWSAIKAFSSTGECSHADDMFYLMSLAGYKPIIEYCGGTEIGGGYITGTMVQPASPSTFSTPALGLDFTILDENEAECDNGELFLIPPSMGLSNQLLCRDHHEVYFTGTPDRRDGTRLRRHGDQMQRLPGGYYRAHGRIDDTMNLGGIKISSAEVERVLNSVDGIRETGAISVASAAGGLERLVVYVVLEPHAKENDRRLKVTLQQALMG